MKVYVDESKKNGFIIVAAAVVRANEEALKREIGTLTTRRGKPSFHMVRETDTTRKAFLSLLADADINVVLYDAGRNGRQLDQRARCLRALVRDAAQWPQAELILDEDESLIEGDRAVLYQSVREFKCRSTVCYSHSKVGSNTLLSIPDAIAWAHHRDQTASLELYNRHISTPKPGRTSPSHWCTGRSSMGLPSKQTGPQTDNQRPHRRRKSPLDSIWCLHARKNANKQAS